MVETVNIGDTFLLQMGKTPDRSNQEYWNNGENNWVSIADLGKYNKYVEETKETISDRAISESGIKAVPPDTVIMSFKLSIGKTAITVNDTYTNEAIMAFIPRNKDLYDVSYLYYLLSNVKWTEGMKRAVMGSTLNKQTISTFNIPCPSKTDQLHIVKILDTISSIIEKRKQQIALLDEAEKSLFVEFFGDNVTIIKWNQQALGNIADIIVGVVIKPAQYYSNANEGVKAFRSLNIAESKIKDENWVYFSVEGQNTNKKSILKEGDVLVVRSGNPGTACVVTKEYEGCNAIDIIIARPKSEYLVSEYLCRFTNSNCCKEMVKSKTNGVAQQHFNVGAYKSLMIPVPPLSLQNDFASRISLIEVHRTEMQTDLKQMEELKSALMQEYFG